MSRLIPETITFRHTVPVQLRFNDADALGHINNNAYFAFYDIGKTTYFDAVYGQYLPPHEIEWVVAHAEIDFVKPIFLPDKIAVQTAVSHIGHKSFDLAQRIVDEKGEIRSEYRSVMVGFDFRQNAAAPIPQVWRDRFSLFEGRKF